MRHAIGSLLEQIFDRLAVRQDRHRPAAVVEERRVVVVDAQVRNIVAQRSLGVSGRSLGCSPLGVGRADDLARAHAAAGDEHRHRLRPVVAAGLRAVRA